MKTTADKIILSSGIGLGAVILGGIFIFLGGCMLFIELYTVGIVLLIPGIFLAGFRVKTVLDKETMMLTKKTGIIAPFIPRIKRSMTGTTSVVLSRHPSHYNFATNFKARSSYTLALEHPDGNIPIDYFDEHEKGYQTGHDIAKWLQVKFYQNLAK